MLIWRKLAAFFLLTCFAGWAAPGGQDGGFSIDVWDTDAGLPQNSVISMARTRDGYLWLGTLDGLVRFDGIGRRASGGLGAEFPVFDERNTPGLNSSLIVKLFEDSQGWLWIGTETGGIARAKDGRLESIDLGRGSREGRLVSICEATNGAVWLYTADGQLARWYNGKTETWRPGPGFPSRSRHLALEKSGVLWVGTDRTLVGLASNSDPTAPALSVVHEVPVRKLDFILASAEGGCWRLAEGRIQKWSGNRLERDLGAYPWDMWNTPVYAACEDRAGNLVVGTGGEGVFLFNAQGNYVHLTVTNGLSYRTILSLLSDKEGNLWVGTDGGGLNRVRRQIFKVQEASRDLVVRSVTEQKDGALWIGYNMARIDCVRKEVTTSYTNVHGLLDLNVRSVLADRNDQVWAGTLGRGLLRFSDGLFLGVPETEFFRRDREVCALYEDRKGRIWAGGADGLTCRDGDGRWALYTTERGLRRNYVRAIGEDASGSIWVGTEGGGLARLEGDRFTPPPGAPIDRKNPFPATTVSCLHWDTNNTLWAGTSLGLVRYASNRWTFYTNHPGLSTATIGYITEDDAGFLWLGSGMGLLRAPKKALDAAAGNSGLDIPVRFYGKPDGLPTRETSRGSQPAVCRSTDGLLWFSTIKGLVSVNPALIERNTNPPPVIIEAVAIDGAFVSSRSLRASVPSSLRIPAGKESLDIYFTSLNLSAPEQCQFRYQLEGHESTSTLLPGNVRSAHYSRVPSGSYVFRVSACNEDGIWNQAGSSLTVVVLPPFWRTWWFMAITALAILAAVGASVHYASTQRLQRQLAVLRQHEALEGERARIARDLHDQLGANLTQVALLGELAETDKDEPGEVEQHARQISQTARDTTRALDEIVWTVNPSNDTFEGLGNYICKYAQDYLETAGIRFRLDVPSQLPATPVYPDLRHNVFLVAKESINNLVKHSQATEAALKLAVTPERLSILIEDNGVGIPPGAENKGRQGLRNMKRRMEDVGGGMEITPREGGGTCVRFWAPLQTPRA